MTRHATYRGAVLGVTAIFFAMWGAAALGNVWAGDPKTSSTVTGEGTREVEPEAAPPAPLPPRATPTRAARSRPTPAPARVAAPTRAGLNWAALARCESGGNPRAVSPSGRYFGLYQFDEPTWRSVGGTGNPADASPAEQTYRAQRLYDRRGAQPWPSCGRWL